MLALHGYKYAMWTIIIVGILSSDHVSVCHSLQWMNDVDLHDNGE